MKQLQLNLRRLVDLRGRELERNQAELAAKEQLRARSAAAVQRLEALNAQLGPTGASAPSLALNGADYKQAVMQWADQQRQHLAVHEADVAAQRQAVLAVARKQEAVGQLLDRVGERLRADDERRQQKGQDDLAGQVWLRGRA
ncbi:flagellar export protein FliJ [Roseateles sp.]|uniref:flagellar export protein FliJ n=1 Tax=Roseateles sp. TaxID=1971397 RepID=UPI0025FEE5E9|nr:flagellar export protein FliJ [Roseateles sp.]MBV8036781.1 flagellar export protein FliJ [Roseateles sp.]